jgi:PAS domain S-box-containing protein
VSDSTLTAAAALDAIDEGVLVQDAETQVVYANRAASELLGVDREQLRGRSELPTPCECLSESGEALPERWPSVDALRTGRPQRPRVMGLPRPDGRVRWVRVSARPIGRSVLTSMLDVTALRNAEEDAATLA